MKTKLFAVTILFLSTISASAGWCSTQRHRWFGLPYLMTHAEFIILPDWQYLDIRFAVYSNDGDLLAEGWQEATVIGWQAVNFACQIDARSGRVEITIPEIDITLSRCRYPVGVTGEKLRE